jgi:hypothetical protein
VDVHGTERLDEVAGQSRLAVEKGHWNRPMSKMSKESQDGINGKSTVTARFGGRFFVPIC